MSMPAIVETNEFYRLDASIRADFAKRSQFGGYRR